MAKSARQYGMFIDLDRCTGCGACVVVCKQEHDLPPRSDAVPGSKGLAYVRLLDVGTEGDYPDLSFYHIPVPCMHCSYPPCIEACPTDAIYRREDGLVLINERACTGCEACPPVCPYGALNMDRDQGTAKKCTLCAHLIDEGQQPACVTACNSEAIIFGNLCDPHSEISQRIKATGDMGFVLKPEKGTSPNVYYVQQWK